MTDHTVDIHGRPDILQELYQSLKAWRARVRQRREVRRNLKALKKLDRRTLQDIGMNPSGLKGVGRGLELTILTAGRLHDPYR